MLNFRVHGRKMQLCNINLISTHMLHTNTGPGCDYQGECQR